MKPTQQMYEVMKEHNPAARNLIAGLEEALKDIPEVEPFAFAGHEGRPVYLHPCGTVVDVDPAHTGIEGSTMQAVLDGDCDCEGGQPWMRVYVEKQA